MNFQFQTFYFLPASSNNKSESGEYDENKLDRLLPPGTVSYGGVEQSKLIAVLCTQYGAGYLQHLICLS